MRFKCCPECGEKLIMKPIGDEGDVPFCERCSRPWFDMFSSAVIVLVVNEDGEAVLLKQNYMSDQYMVLISGFIKPGESAEDTARREVLEEVGLELEKNKLVATYWFERGGMMMIAFIARAKKAELKLSGEVDEARWIPCEEAITLVHPKGAPSHNLLDEYLKRDVSEKFAEEMKSVKWFANGGEETEKYLTVHSVYEAYDDWNDNYLSVWEPHTELLEKLAEEIIGEDAVDDIFEFVSAALGDEIYRAWGEFRERAGLSEQNALDEEITDMVKRDLCWACVEKAMNRPGFFTELLDVYRDGRFPCGYDGEYPYGRFAVM